jgi:hypothetical protein
MGNSETTRFNESVPCRLCGGTRGSGYDGAHELCKARQKLGLPIECLGYACKICGGIGRTGETESVSPVFSDPAALARYCEKRWPSCTACDGTGVAK